MRNMESNDVWKTIIKFSLESIWFGAFWAAILEILHYRFRWSFVLLFGVFWGIRFFVMMAIPKILFQIWR